MPTRDKSSNASSLLRSPPVLIPVVAGLLLLLVAAILGLLLVWERLASGEESVPAMPAEVVKVTPTSFASAIIPPAAECETVVSSEDAQVTVPLPASLVVGDWSVSITPMILQESSVSYPAGYSNTAVWLCGTVVNYIVVLEPTSNNDALLKSLRPGDEIKLQLASGTDLVFRFSELLKASVGDPNVLAQSRPHLTVILQSDGSTWLVAGADYVAESEQVSPPGGGHSPPGQAVRVANAEVTVEEGYVEVDEPGLQPGTMYYLIEFSVENTGSESINLNGFAMRLQDSTGHWYSVSPEASAVGKHGWLMTEIAPGSTAQGTAGYIVPETMAGPAVVWSFAALSSEGQASFSIPYQATGSSAGVERVNVAVTDAFLSRDGNVVVVEGKLENVGDETVTVELVDISLTSSAGASDLRMAAPPLPWTIQLGKTQVIELQFSRPDASAALLSLLGYTFELQGLK